MTNEQLAAILIGIQTVVEQTRRDTDNAFWSVRERVKSEIGISMEDPHWIDSVSVNCFRELEILLREQICAAKGMT